MKKTPTGVVTQRAAGRPPLLLMLWIASRRNSPAKSTRLIVKNNDLQRLENFVCKTSDLRRRSARISMRINAGTVARDCAAAAPAAALPARCRCGKRAPYDRRASNKSPARVPGRAFGTLRELQFP